MCQIFIRRRNMELYNLLILIPYLPKLFRVGHLWSQPAAPHEVFYKILIGIVYNEFGYDEYVRDNNHIGMRISGHGHPWVLILAFINNAETIVLPSIYRKILNILKMR